MLKVTVKEIISLSIYRIEIIIQRIGIILFHIFITNLFKGKDVEYISQRLNST